MAGEEDVELRDLVAQSLEDKGVLGKIRAQLRANVFLALEEQESKEKPHPFVSEKLQNFQKTKEGRQTVALVREFLEFFKLDFTTAVFDPETNACDSYPGRERLARDVGVEISTDTPLLASLLRRTHIQSPSHTLPTSLHTFHLPSHAATFPSSLTHHHTSLPHTHITNGNALPPLTSDPTHSWPHHHQTTANVSTAINSSATPTTDITMVTSTINTTRVSGEPLQSKITSSPQQQGHNTKDIAVSSTANQQILSSSRNTDTLADGGGDDGGGGGEFVATTQRISDLDAFFKTLPPPPTTTNLLTLSNPPSNPPLNPTKEDESETSIAESIADSMASGKTTDITQTDQSFHGDYDYETEIISQEH